MQMQDIISILLLVITLVAMALYAVKRKWSDAVLVTGIGLMVFDRYLPGAFWPGIILTVGTLGWRAVESARARGHPR